MVTYLEFLTRLPSIPHQMLLAHSCFPFCGKMFEMTTLGKYVDLSENFVDLLDNDEDLIENDVDLTDHYIDLSDVK